VEDNAEDTASRPLIERAPSLGERFRHLFGIHSWEQRSVEGRTREFCVGCHQERNAVTRFRPPVDFPSQATPSQTSTPEEESRPFQFPPNEETREARQPRAQDRKGEGDLASVWQWIVGLRLWVKILAGFIALQVIGSIVSLFTRS
jgi:hypothetical protein